MNELCDLTTEFLTDPFSPKVLNKMAVLLSPVYRVFIIVTFNVCVDA